MVAAEFVIRLPATTSAPGRARAFVRDHWSQLADADVLDAVALCVSELVTNALDHARPPYLLRLCTTGYSLRVEVDDASAAAPVVHTGIPNDARGRGMFLVDHLAKSWGVAPSATGKTVWAEF
jgi:anti-sigma regulatory factor (Ser/Thr protein kinase)